MRRSVKIEHVLNMNIFFDKQNSFFDYLRVDITYISNNSKTRHTKSTAYYIYKFGCFSHCNKKTLKIIDFGN